MAELNPIRYRSYYYDIETDLYYLNSRYYNPEIGRFINADSIEYLGANNDLIAYNLYQYCSNNPVNKIDPSGHIAVVDDVLIGCAIALGTLFTLIVAPIAIEFADGIVKNIYDESQDKTKEKESVKDSVSQNSKTIYIYRHRGTNPGNLVPTRNDVLLNSGLSFSTIPMPNSWQTTIDQINATGLLFAVQDKPTHVSVYPIGGTIADWRSAGASSVWTLALIAVCIKIK